MRHSRHEDGFVLDSAIVLLTVIMGLGLGLLLFTDTQTKASARERATEAAYNVAEAALNAQVGQASRAFPAGKEEAFPDVPTNGTVSCTEASTSTNGCPTAGSLSVGYPNISPLSCSASTPKDAWGSPLTNQWTTYVRDDAASSTAFNSAAERIEPGYDANADGKLWIRSVGVVQCRLVSVITLVSRQLVALNF